MTSRAALADAVRPFAPSGRLLSAHVPLSTPRLTCWVYLGLLRPITWSSRDTDETIREVKEYNAVWARLCDAAS